MLWDSVFMLCATQFNLVGPQVFEAAVNRSAESFRRLTTRRHLMSSLREKMITYTKTCVLVFRYPSKLEPTVKKKRSTCYPTSFPVIGG